MVDKECGACGGYGFIMADKDATGYLEIQRCDACNSEVGDNDATTAVFMLARAALDLCRRGGQEAAAFATEDVRHALRLLQAEPVPALQGKSNLLPFPVTIEPEVAEKARDIKRGNKDVGFTVAVELLPIVSVSSQYGSFPLQPDAAFDHVKDVLGDYLGQFGLDCSRPEEMKDLVAEIRVIDAETL